MGRSSHPCARRTANLPALLAPAGGRRILATGRGSPNGNSGPVRGRRFTTKALRALRGTKEMQGKGRATNLGTEPTLTALFFALLLGASSCPSYLRGSSF